jgi:membrane associated rhomboid family serine protease
MAENTPDPTDVATQPDQSEAASSGDIRADVRFTAHEGFAGWLEAKSTGNLLYGSGAVRLYGDRFNASGWTRTWLGVSQPTHLEFALSDIASSFVDGQSICLSVHISGRRRTLSLQVNDATLVSKLAAHLAKRNGGDQDWEELQSFNRAMVATTPHTYVTSALVVTNLLVFFVLFGLSASPLSVYAARLQSGGVNVATLTLNGEWWRLATAIFLHANLPHLAFNLWALWNIGRLCERLFGHATFIVLYLLCGLVASMSTVVWDAAHFSIGASGAIFGLFGAFFAVLALGQMNVPQSYVRAHRWSIATFIVVNLVAGAFTYVVDNAAHVGGLVAGLLLGGLLAANAHVADVGRARPGRLSAAVAAALAMLVAGIWFARGGSTELPASYRWLQSHQWYFAEEPANLKSWLDLDHDLNSGTVSRQIAAQRFSRDVLPFWVAASRRLSQEVHIKDPDPLSQALAAFVVARLDLADAWLRELRGDAGRKSDELSNLMRAMMLAQARFGYQSTRRTLADRPFSMTELPWVARMRAATDFKTTNCITDRNALYQSNTPGSSPSDGPSQRRAIGCKAQAYFKSGSFEALDSQLRRHAGALADLEDGSSSFSGDITGIDDYFEFSGIDANRLLIALSNWRRTVPTSPYPDVLEAMLYHTMAWKTRGSGYADSVSNDQWQAFAMQNEMAAAAIEDAELKGRLTPMWYPLAIDIGLDRKADAEYLRATFDAGVERFPGFERQYRSMMRTLMPRWGGSFESLEEFIRTVSERERLWTPDARYAFLHAQLAELEGDETDLFADVGGDWPRMKRGFEDLSQMYPRSDVILNRYLAFTCRAHDLAQYQAVRPRVTKRRAPSAWTRAITLESCDKDMEAIARLASTPTKSVDSDASASSRSSRTLWKVRLGMTRVEVERARGLPVKVDNYVAYYNAGGPDDDALVQIIYGRASRGSVQPVRAILYAGDREHAPPELPFIGGATRAQLQAHFGEPVWQSERRDGMQYLEFIGGVAVNLWEDQVTDYGISESHATQ